MKNPDEIQKLGTRVRQLREKAGLTQDALAFDAGMGRATLQRIEAGTQAVSADLLFSLIRALQLQPAEFFKGFTIELED